MSCLQRVYGPVELKHYVGKATSDVKLWANLVERCVLGRAVVADLSRYRPAGEVLGELSGGARREREAGRLEPPFRSPAASSGTSNTAQRCPWPEPRGLGCYDPTPGTVHPGRWAKTQPLGISGQMSLQRGQPSSTRWARVPAAPSSWVPAVGSLLFNYCLCFIFTPHPEPLCRKPVRCIGELGKEVHCGEETTSVSAELPWALAD